MFCTLNARHGPSVDTQAGAVEVFSQTQKPQTPGFL